MLQMSFVSSQLIFEIALVQYFIIFSDEKVARTSLIALTPLVYLDNNILSRLHS